MQFKPLLYLLMRLRTLLLVSTALLLAVTCDKKKEEPEPQPPVTPKIEIPSESQAVFSQGISIQAGTQAQSQTVKFTATAAWSADVADTKASSWLSVQPTSGGAGAVTMTVTAQPNTTDKARSSTVTIQCGTIKQSFTVNQDAAAPQTIAVESVTLNKTELTLEPSGTETLIATVAPENASDKTVTWSISNAEIATVADGKVTAVKEGEAIITAKASEKQATCKVTVKKGVVAVTSVTLNKEQLDLKKGEDETLVATVAPDDATDKTVTWTTSNAGVATVVDGLVTAVEEGTAIIQASAGDKTARCEVAVTAYHISVSPTSLSFLSAGGSKDIKISCNGDWSISGQPSWCTPSATTGTGDATIQLTVSANNDAKRTGSLTITCSGMTKTVSITQIGSGWQNQRFVHKSLYLMFTSVHCGYSVGMNERIKLADEKVGDKYCRVDVHGRGMGNPLLESPIDFDEAPTLYGLFYGGIPSGVIDYRIRIRNWSDSDSHLVVENFVSAIAEQEKIYPAQTGVSFVSSISGSTLTVSGKVYSHVAEDFKISVYLLEDGIQGSSLGYTSDFYTSRQFDNVLRLSLSNVLGDEISFGTKNSVQEFKYSTTIPEGYNKDNLSILVIVQRGYADQIVREEYMGDYYVDNCRKAKVGTEARLEVYENASGGGNEGISIGDDITF